MNRIPIILALAAFSGCSQLKSDYAQYDRSHTRRIDVSYDSDSHTTELGYTITAQAPVAGYGK